MWRGETFALSVVLITMLWPVVLVHLSGGTRSCQWLHLARLWVKRTGAGVLDLAGSFQAGINAQLIRRSGGVGNKVCVWHLHLRLAGRQGGHWAAWRSAEERGQSGLCYNLCYGGQTRQNQ